MIDLIFSESKDIRIKIAATATIIDSMYLITFAKEELFAKTIIRVISNIIKASAMKYTIHCRDELFLVIFLFQSLVVLSMLLPTFRKTSLFTILSFPILLPVLISGISATKKAVTEQMFSSASSELQVSTNTYYIR